ncbi:MAG: 2OG-Fe(II) oxygenase [Flavobacteriaceae bacterium]
MEIIDRVSLASKITNRLKKNQRELHEFFIKTKNGVPFFYIDDLLPKEWCAAINNSFPETSDMMLKKSLREDKFVGVKMNQYHPLIEEITYAFQDSRVVEIVQEICGIDSCHPDPTLYVGGISSMTENQFLKPHLDNSHNQKRDKWRVLNLLYYTSADWIESYGGNLEVWPEGLKGAPITITSKFNRLVVMGTDSSSWHSVSPVVVNKSRNCVSNYYFSDKPLSASDSFHVTLFRAWPKQKWDDLVLRIDGFARMTLRKIFPKGIKKNPHVYKNRPK